MTIPWLTDEVPYLTTEQMVEVDRAMIEEYKIELVQMMENAGRSLARLASERFLVTRTVGGRVTILAGTGGNGGGALVCARRLHGWGARVEVFVTAADLGPVPGHQLEILRRMGVAVETAGGVGSSAPADLVIDGVIGYSLRGAPRGAASDLIRWANGQQAPILSLDVPSGVDSTTGTVFDPAISATATMTLALPKDGLRAPGVEKTVGELYLADIGVPPQLYANPALQLHVGPVFAAGEILRVR
jgi:NAD(P)H-hydrate epimerase